MRAIRLAPVLLVVTLLAGARGAAAQAAGPTLGGPRVTYNFDVEEAAIGGQFIIPLNSRFDFYPSLDIFLPDDGSLFAINADLRFHPAPRDAAQLYLGGGVNISRAAYRGRSNSDAGVNLFAGLEGRSGVIRPFGELRVILSDGSSVQMAGGLNILLGR
ncbi:MAG: hypothetical protein IT361_16920 [Gemmatimonadaceae bacterium]|nr:hypothetical protein [Gemmatimonadaceae bacterium]